MDSAPSRAGSVSVSGEHATHESIHARKKRQLDLVKCDRCRLDKQKCLPIRRAWPTKCTRCCAKGLSCSEGNRVARSSKYRSNVPPPLNNEPVDSIQMHNIEERIYQALLLYRYHMNMNMGRDELRQMKIATTSPFFSMEYTFLQNGDGERLLQTFNEHLKAAFLKVTNELLSKDSSIRHLPGTLLPGLLGEILTFTSPTDTCPICAPSLLDQELIRGLKQAHDISNEYAARRYRLRKHLRKCPRGENPQILCELVRYQDLSFAVIHEAQNVLQQLQMHEAAAMPQKVGLHQYTSIGAQYFKLGWEQHDCLGRTALHNWLEYSTHRDNSSSLAMLASGSLRAANVATINKQDILGRSPLHIACQQDWKEGVDALLKLGANPEATTRLGSLPLHYAAANGSAEICERLLQAKHLDEAAMIDCQGRTALYYADEKKHTEAANVLFKYRLKRSSHETGSDQAVPNLDSPEVLGLAESTTVSTAEYSWNDFVRDESLALARDHGTSGLRSFIGNDQSASGPPGNSNFQLPRSPGLPMLEGRGAGHVASGDLSWRHPSQMYSFKPA